MPGGKPLSKTKSTSSAWHILYSQDTSLYSSQTLLHSAVSGFSSYHIAYTANSSLWRVGFISESLRHLQILTLCFV